MQVCAPTLSDLPEPSPGVEAEKATDSAATRIADHRQRDLLLTAAERAKTYYDGNGDAFHSLLAEHFRASVDEGHLSPSLLALATEVVEFW